MTTNIQFRLLTTKLLNIYIEVGTQSYLQHYPHLWKNADPAPYIQSSFRPELLSNQLQNKNLQHFIICFRKKPVGIFKMVINAKIGPYSSTDALLLEKVYLLKEYSGQGLGKVVLKYVENRSQKLKKQILWLDTMKEGPALKFYLDNGFTILREASLEFNNVKKEERPMYILYKLL